MTVKNDFPIDMRDLPGAGHAAITTATGNITLVDTDGVIRTIDPGGAARDVTLPAEGTANHPYFIRNSADAAENLVFKNDAAATIVTVGQGQRALIWPDGTNWQGDLIGASTAMPTGTYGAANPTQPTYGDTIPFFRTDLGWWIYYDGTRWLTTYEFVFNSLVLNTAATTDQHLGTVRTDYAMYITRCATASHVATTNNGSNYWTISLKTTTLALASDSEFDTFSTSADSADTWTTHEQAPATTATPTKQAALAYVGTKTAGAPGNYSLAASIYYRLIVT